MRKNGMLMICIWVIIIMVGCALMMDGLTADHRTLLLLFAAVAGDVYMVCESRVQRANAPLILRDETIPEKSKPPEGNAE